MLCQCACESTLASMVQWLHALLPRLVEHATTLMDDTVMTSSILAQEDEYCVDVDASVSRALRHQLLPEHNTRDAVRMRYICDVELDKVRMTQSDPVLKKIILKKNTIVFDFTEIIKRAGVNFVLKKQKDCFTSVLQLLIIKQQYSSNI